MLPLKTVWEVHFVEKMILKMGVLFIFYGLGDKYFCILIRVYDSFSLILHTILKTWWRNRLKFILIYICKFKKIVGNQKRGSPPTFLHQRALLDVRA